MKRTALIKAVSTLVVIALILPSAVMAGTTHKIRQGDTLSALASRYHTSVAKICQANHIRENAVLKLDKSIRIPTKPQYSRVKHSASHAVSASRLVHTTSNSVYLRSGPSTRHGKVVNLRAGTTLKQIAVYGSWRKVVLSNGVGGFVYGSLVAKGSGTITASAQKAPSVPTQVCSADQALVRTALAYRGSRYARGGTSRGGFDCSGFTRYVYSKYGVHLPHSSAAQAHIGTSVSRGSLKQGDLVFFNRTYRRGVSHVGIYIGNGSFIHASTYGRGVRVDSLNHSYYVSRYCGARRVK